MFSRKRTLVSLCQNVIVRRLYRFSRYTLRIKYIFIKMVKKCCIKSCKRQWQPNGSVSFHSFPLKKKELLEKWMQSIPGGRQEPTRHDYICSQHFTADSFNNSTLERIRLKDGAVPNIFTDIVDTRKHVQDTTDDPHFDGVMELDINNSHVVSIGQDNQSHILDSSNNEKSVQFCVTAVQVSPHHLKPSDEAQTLQRRIKILQQRSKRREQKLSTIKQIIGYLKANRVCTPKLEEVLIHRFQKCSFKRFSNEAINADTAKGHKRYSDTIKDFALTLYFYSPRAYTLVKSKFNLPHAATIRKWLSQSPCKYLAR